MIMKKLIGKVTEEEKKEIQSLYERKNGLTELAKILNFSAASLTKKRQLL